MFYPQEIIDQVIEANNIVDVIGSYVQLTKKGSTYFGLCPFHNEKTPSFSVTDNGSKQMFYCFGCHKGGDVIDFVAQYFGLNFLDAMRKLNQDFSLGLPLDGSTDKEAEKKAKQLAYQRRQAEARRKKRLQALQNAYDRALTRFATIDAVCDNARTEAKNSPSEDVDIFSDNTAYALRNIDSAWYELCEAQSRLSEFERLCRE